MIAPAPGQPTDPTRRHRRHLGHSVEVTIELTNTLGAKEQRRIIPIKLHFGHSEHHHEDQWLLEAWDVQKKARSTFAMKSVHDWRL
jgi:hypothetical protein